MKKWMKVAGLFLAWMIPVAGNAAQFGDFTYTNINSTITITEYTGSSKTVIIPDTISSFPVASIGMYAFYNTKLSSVTIPSSVTNIGASAFRSCTNLASVTIPNSVTYIEGYAFMDCTSLTNAMIGSGVASIETYLFYNCTGLTSVTIGNSVTSIGGSAFAFCRNLARVTIPSSVTNIGIGAFARSGLTGVNIPNSVTSLGGFDGCTNLTSIVIPNGVTNIQSGAFSDCTGLTNVIIGINVASIGDQAFQNCTRLTSVAIPNGVVSIGESAFEDCVGLTNVTIGNRVTTIGDAAFSGCTGLILVTMGSGVTYIGDWAFYGCTSLTGITIPNSVTTIGESAFKNCARMTNLMLGSSVVTIERNAFSGCDGLTAITVDPAHPFYSSADGVWFDKNQTTLIRYPVSRAGSYTVPNSVTTIGDSSFSGCTNLTSATMGTNVVSIGEHAFSGCTNLAHFSSPSPSKLRILGDYAFSGVILMPSFNITSIITSIGNSTFNGCTNLTSITVNTNNSFYSSVDGVLFDKNQTQLIKCPEGKAGSFTIPGTVERVGIIWDDTFAFYSISDAFVGCHRLTNVTIPDSVTDMYGDAFESCSSLTSITVGVSNTVMSSVDGVLFNKSQTTLFQYPRSKTGSFMIASNVTNIWDAALDSCTGLTSITVNASNAFYRSMDGVLFNKSRTELYQYPAGKTGSYAIPSGVTGIYGDAFSGCTSLYDVMITNNLASIGADAFYRCYSLINVTIGTNVTSIGVLAFKECTSLKNVMIGSRVASIGFQAFAGCTSLVRLEIPKSVTELGGAIFDGCVSLTGVCFLGNAPATPSYFYDVFYGADNTTVYRLPAALGWPAVPSVWEGRPTALWNPNPVYAVTFNEQGGAIPSPSSTKSVTNGATYGSLPTTTYAGYSFGGWWTGPGGTDSQITSSTEVSLTSDQTLYAKWIPAGSIYTLTVIGGSGGGLTYTNSQEVAISANPPIVGQTFDCWMGDTQYVASVTSSNTTVTMPAQDITVTATYKDILYSLTVEQGSGGGISYTYQQQVEIEADPPPVGYVFYQWVGATQYVSSVTSSVAVVTMPAQDLALSATYRDANTYVLTISGGTGGGFYTAGESVEITADTPPPGRTFDRWTGDTQYVADASSATTMVTMPSGPVSLSAQYRAILYTLTASASGKGRIEPFGEIQVEHGATQIFTAVPDAGYQVKHWLAGSDVVAEGQSTLSVIAEGDRTVSVVFEAGVPLSSWLVFEGRSQRQRLDESGGKRGEPVVLKETLSTLLVVNRDRPGQTNVVLVSWGKSGVQTQAVVAVSMDDSYLVSAKTDKSGRPAAERNLWSLCIRDDGGKSLLIGTFDGAYRYDKAGVLLRVQQRASLNGAGLSPEDPSFSAGLLRLNQTAGDALLKADGNFAAMAAALRTQIKKLPAGVSDGTLSGLLQNAAGE